MENIKEKINIISRMYKIENFENYNEYISMTYDCYVDHYLKESINNLNWILSHIEDEKIRSILILLESNKVTCYRNHCKRFRVKGYSRMNFEQLKSALTEIVNQKILHIKNLAKKK